MSHHSLSRLLHGFRPVEISRMTHPSDLESADPKISLPNVHRAQLAATLILDHFWGHVHWCTC
jgi:hypothetical protein